MSNSIGFNKLAWNPKKNWHKYTKWLNRLWYYRHPAFWLLIPFSLCYQAIVALRRFYLTTFTQIRFPIPVIVVGDITVGGVGKTPMVMAIAEQCALRGIKVGIVTRGYGCHLKQFPHLVQKGDDAYWVGDEPLLMAQKTGCPVVIDPDRPAAVKCLINHHKVQIIISDDGLQHYRMGRALEIVVTDSSRGIGNGWCLPAGPLREGKKRLKKVNFIITNGDVHGHSYSMHLEPLSIKPLKGAKLFHMGKRLRPLLELEIQSVFLTP